MEFDDIQKMALGKVSAIMLKSDGRAEVNETMFTVNYWKRLGITTDFFKLGKHLSLEKSCIIIANFSEEQKRFTTAFLGTLMLADGKMANEELLFMNFLRKKCALPKMTPKECVHELKEFSLINFM